MSEPHVCPPGSLYVCPTAREVESSCHGGHDVCCDRPDLHVPIPDGPGAEALSVALSEAAKREYRRDAEIARLGRRVEDWKTAAGAGMRLTDELRAERDALAAGVPLVCSDERHKTKVFALQVIIERVRAECDRIEAAVRDNPMNPDFDGAYLAAIGHVRSAADGGKEA